MNEDYERLPSRVRAIVDNVRAGQRLVKFQRSKENGEKEILFYYEPSNRNCGPKSAAQAIASGLLTPSEDGLFGGETSQTWTAS